MAKSRGRRLLASPRRAPFTRRQFMRRLAAIVPSPRVHRARYLGVFALRGCL
ncbi:MAG: transposase [Deltaproteobacteria bacterium]|nr:transposase [Deltaproteobacteria bacterium]